MNTFVLFFALPGMLFSFSAATPIARLMDASVAGVYLFSAVVMVAIATGVARRRALKWNDAAFGALVATFPNSGFVGVPLLVALLGHAAAAPAIVALTLDMVLTSSMCIALSQLGHKGPTGITNSGPARRPLAHAAISMVRNPLPWAIGLGSLTSVTGVALPGWLRQTVGMLAAAASPVALFALGALLARSQLQDARSHSALRETLGVVATKLVLHPLLVLAVGHVAIAAGAPIDPFAVAVLVLVAALPSASNVPMLAERFHADAGRLSRVVLMSTVCAGVSFTAILVWLDPRALPARSHAEATERAPR